MDDREKAFENAAGTTARLEETAYRPAVRVRGYELLCIEGPDKGKKIRISGPRVTIGKGPGNDIVLFDDAISRNHLTIEDQPEGYLLKDLGSTNGTLLDGTLTREAYLSPGATIALGHTTLHFQLQHTTLHVLPSEKREFAGMIGHSGVMRQLFGFLEKVAPTELSVVLLGETGAGKEMVARAIHQTSKRRNGPFVVFDCGAHDASLVAAALFGHREGAFTGATGSRKGAFVSAYGGTVFLDEIGDLPLDMQPKLLRVLDHREVVPIGSDQPVKVDVRVVCATHRNLPAMVSEGKFRQDLFYRLSGLVLELPALRKRLEDLVPLAERFLASTKPGMKLDASAHAVLQAHAWPGNVRELRNVIERAAAFAGENNLDASSLLLGHAEPTAAPEPPVRTTKPEALKSLEQVEKEQIKIVLAATGWNKSAASRILGITTKTLRDKIERYGIVEKGDPRSSDE